MRGRRRSWLLGLTLGLCLASLADAQSLSHDPRPRVSRASPPRGGSVCGPTSITESTTQNIISGNSIACSDQTSGFTFENHYWRAFDLPTFGINGEFEVCEVQIAVEAAVSIAGTQPLSVSLYSTTVGTFPAGTLTPIGNASLSVPDQDQTFLSVPITGSVPPASALVVEVVSPDGTGDLFAFFIGSNADGQTAPSYLSALNCGIATPTDLAALEFPDMHIVMTVRGTESPLGPAALSVDAAGNHVLDPNETVIVSPSWTNSGPIPVALTGTATNFTGPGGPADPIYTIAHGTADYGTIPVATTAACSDCYSLGLTTVSRPVQHWDATFDESVSPTGGPKTWTLHVGGSFQDVSTDIVVDPYYPSIETIYHNAVTGGCHTGADFCPASSNLRSEMAVFLLKASQVPGYTPPDCTGVFTDVPCPATPEFPFSNWIEDLYGRNITAGCSSQPGPPPTVQYCPDADILRSQMAVFLLKASQVPGYTPPGCTGVFSDVPCPATPEFPYSDWIEDLYGRGITSGCGSDPGPPPTIQYCPDNPVLRQEMAVFLTKTFNLVLYGL